MAEPFVDIRIFGDKAVARMLAKLPDKMQKTAVRIPMRKSAKRMKAAIVAAVPVKTGRLKAAMRAEKLLLTQNKRTGLIQYTIDLPPRAAVGIDPKDEFYYPTHLEFGHGNVPPHSFIRAPVNRMQDAEIAQMGRDIGKETIRLAKKLAKSK